MSSSSESDHRKFDRHFMRHLYNKLINDDFVVVISNKSEISEHLTLIPLFLYLIISSKTLRINLKY